MRLSIIQRSIFSVPMKALIRLLNTSESTGLFILRLALGVIFFAHGSQKAFGWFGGHGFEGTMGFFTNGLHIPYVFGVLAIAAELLGGLGVFFGVLTRIAAFGIASTMVVAIALVHGKNGLFLDNKGYEYALLALAAAVCLMIRGGGFLSGDKAIAKRIGESAGPRLSGNV